MEALLLFYWLNRRFRGLLNVRDTLLRALLPSLPFAAGVYWLVEHQFAGSGDLTRAALAAGLMVLGLALTTPFIWRELKLMLRLGAERKSAAEP